MAVVPMLIVEPAAYLRGVRGPGGTARDIEVPHERGYWEATYGGLAWSSAIREDPIEAAAAALHNAHYWLFEAGGKHAPGPIEKART